MELDERHIHDGHRKRMREKLIKHDGDIFESYELLEMLLFLRLPYKNTNPIAKKLLHRFGSLRAVFDAGAKDLCEVSGIGERCAEFLARVGELFYVESDDAATGNARECADERELAKMIRALFSRVPDVTFAMLAFDNSSRVIATETRCDVDFNSGALNAAYYTDFALRSSASMVITASNRRYGSALPKPADRESAVMVSKALSSIDVHYGEHFVFAGNNYSKVLPTLTASPLNVTLLSNGIVNEINGDNAVYVNDNCHNSDVIELFDKTISAFCSDHIVKTQMLFSRFGSLAEIMMTDYRTLSELVGSPLAIFVRLLSNIAKRRVTDLVKISDIKSDAELSEYLSALCIPLCRECVFLISYDSGGRVISIDRAGEGTLNSSSVTPRALLELAMRNGAKRVGVAHNHPYGRSEFSGADIAFTKSLYDAFLALGIELTKHFCISAQGVFAISAPFDNL